jgi:hypothetical protein
MFVKNLKIIRSILKGLVTDVFCIEISSYRPLNIKTYIAVLRSVSRIKMLSFEDLCTLLKLIEMA